MKKIFKKLSPYLIRFGERGVSIVAFYFPFVEVVCYFGPKVYFNTDSVVLRMFYLTYVEKLARFYHDNNLIMFIFMVWVFTVCARGSFPLTKYVRYNIIQAILLNVVCSCSGVVFTFLPIVIREGMVGIVFANSLFWNIILLIAYSSLLIAYGRYPKIPILSEAAKIQVQQF